VLKIRSISFIHVQEQVTFAPDSFQSLVHIPQAKSDFFGIGYDPAKENPEIHASRESNATTKTFGQRVYRMDAVKPNHTSFTGNEALRSVSDSVSFRDVAGFSMNDDEDDVYDSHSSAAASQPIHSRSSIEEVESDDEHIVFKDSSTKRARSGMSARTAISTSVDNWLGSTVAHSSSLQRCPTDGKTVLDGFDLASLEFSLPLMPFETPLAPLGFKAGHIFSDTVTAKSSISDRRRRGVGGAAVSAALLNDSIDTKVKSIFDIVGDQAKKQIQSAIDSRNNNSILSSTISQVDGAKTSRPMLTSDAVLKSNFAGLSQAFQNRFVSSSSATPSDATTPSAGLTTAKEHAISVQAVPSVSVVASQKVELDSEAYSRSNPPAGSTASFLSHQANHIHPVSQGQGKDQGQGQDLVSGAATGFGLSQSRAPGSSSGFSSGSGSSSSSGSGSSVSMAKDSNDLKGSARRTTREWHPVPLLSRRFHIKVEGLTAGMANGRQNQLMKGTPIVDSKLDSMFAGLRESSVIVSHDLGITESEVSSLVGEDVIAEKEVVKPPMSLFKSIFEDSDSDSDSDEEEDKEVDEDLKNKEKEKEKVKGSNAPSEKQNSSETQRVISAKSAKTSTDEIPDKGPSSFLRTKFGNLAEKSQSLIPQGENSRAIRVATDTVSGIIIPESPVPSVTEVGNKVEEEEVRVVFRKPSNKARVNTFSTKAKQQIKIKRSFSTMDEGDDDPDDGDDVSMSVSLCDRAIAVAVSSKRERKYIDRSVDEFNSEVETSRLIQEMQEGVKEEEERDAANAQAAGSFFTNMVDSTKSQIACLISDAVAAANDIIIAAEAESEVEGMSDGEVQAVRMARDEGGDNGEKGDLEGTVESRIVSEWYSRSAQRMQELPQGKGQDGGQNNAQGGPINLTSDRNEINRKEEHLKGVSDGDDRREKREKRKKDKKKKDKRHSQRKSTRDQDDDEKVKVKKSKKSKDKSSSKSSKKDSRHSSKVAETNRDASSSSDSDDHNHSGSD
jgi:hypothetical protein